MASQNRTLGKFDLVGIPPAPRGVPQIEVTFDIDANGIVHVSAKDLGTGKEQKIRIESSSGLSEEEIRRMVKEADAHAAEDRAERERAELQNEADGLIYSTEKSLRDYGSKVGEADRQAIEHAIQELRSALDTGDARAIRSSTDGLKQAAYRLAEEVYRASSAPANGGTSSGAPGEGSDGGSKGQTESADYEVVDDEKQKN
jgi:molecular chaperone DnaK